MLCPRCSRRYDDQHRFCPHDGAQLAERPDIRRIRVKPTEQVGQIVGGRYQMRGLIGAGAMAEVFLAQDKTTGDPVAVKLLNARHLKDPMKKARFMLEATAGAKIVHDNVLKVLDVGLRDDGAPYLVMEYLSGESLADWLRREKVMTPALAIPLLIQIASGLDAAHRAGIIHRDIKPGNVFLIGEKGAPHTAKVVDFGFARLAEFRGLTQAGMAVGTIEYMAPEQAVGDSAEVRTDVYGLGVVMYRMFTGRIPFTMRSDGELLAHQFLVHPPPPALGTEGIAPRIEAVILKALRKRLENRYPSMSALVADLERITHPAGPPQALAPIHEPDLYAPQTPFAVNTAGYYYRVLGKQPPP
ncbi:serine/threonine-protein kinase [Chondromyces apiculatus]|uniref:Serine/threonine protein kinase n=1 Tax=Chondromyces apiculatus DSM 436 TaxID=1192034 RepID=A0A017TES3_9BACT|nr:serine/threonine-protein kinase [Chondromyces apiculatus]EYF07330.1 serine/threonine protein kinase [Chondromyces apiculatus DSM 436]